MFISTFAYTFNCDEIRYFEMVGDAPYIHFEDGSKLQVDSKTIGELLTGMSKAGILDVCHTTTK